MQTDVKTVQTPYGEATIDVVECDSCKTEVAKRKTVEFTLGDRNGRACEHCYDTGPVSFPEKVFEYKPPEDYSGDGLLHHTIVYPIFAPGGILFAFAEGDDFVEGYAIGIIGTLLWIVLPLLIYIL